MRTFGTIVVDPETGEVYDDFVLIKTPKPKEKQ